MGRIGGKFLRYFAEILHAPAFEAPFFHMGAQGGYDHRVVLHDENAVQRHPSFERVFTKVYYTMFWKDWQRTAVSGLTKRKEKEYNEFWRACGAMFLILWKKWELDQRCSFRND